jgi:hypothetical protein
LLQWQSGLPCESAEQTEHGGAANAPVIRAIVDLPPGQRIQDALRVRRSRSRRKGDMIAYDHWKRRLSNIHSPHQRAGAALVLDVNNATVAGRNLAFSPDGRWLAFTEGNALKRWRSMAGRSSASKR